MTMTVAELFKRHSLHPSGPTKWGEPVPCDLPGVYVVTQHPNPLASSGVAVPIELPFELRRHWLSDQPIVYIGKAGGPDIKATLRTRIRQFYRHHHGKPSPHSGGQDVKLLGTRPLWLFWSPTPGYAPRDLESQMLKAFVAEAHHWPFANRRD